MNLPISVNTRIFVRVSVSFLLLALAACSGAMTSSPTPIPATGSAPTVDVTVEPTSNQSENFIEGADLYAANCQVCHGDSNGIGGNGVAPPHNKDGHTWHHPDAQIKDWVLNGKLGFGGPAMPDFGNKLTELEVDAIMTFIKIWWAPDQRESQADISQRYQEALDKQQKQ